MLVGCELPTAAGVKWWSGARRRSERSRPRARPRHGGPAPLASDAGGALACARDARPAPWPAVGLPLCVLGSVHARILCASGRIWPQNRPALDEAEADRLTLSKQAKEDLGRAPCRIRSKAKKTLSLASFNSWRTTPAAWLASST